MQASVVLSFLLGSAFFLSPAVEAAEEAPAQEKPLPCCATPEMLANTCVGCHGPQGNSVGPAIPHLAEMSPNYFVGAMLAYKYDNDPDRIDAVLAKDPAIVGSAGLRLDEVEKFLRVSTVMGRLGKGYTLDEIKQMATYFAEQKFVPHPQQYDQKMAKAGKKLHDKHCEKCHEDNGRSPEADAGILAGQWMPYLRYTMDDYRTGVREMPPKMKKEIKDLWEKQGPTAFEQLIHFYASPLSYESQK